MEDTRRGAARFASRPRLVCALFFSIPARSILKGLGKSKCQLRNRQEMYVRTCSPSGVSAVHLENLLIVVVSRPMPGFGPQPVLSKEHQSGFCRRILGWDEVRFFGGASSWVPKGCGLLDVVRVRGAGFRQGASCWVWSGFLLFNFVTIRAAGSRREEFP